MNDPVVIASACAALGTTTGFLLGYFLRRHELKEAEKRIAKLASSNDIATRDILDKNRTIAELQTSINIPKDKKHDILENVQSLLLKLGLTSADVKAWEEHRRQAQQVEQIKKERIDNALSYAQLQQAAYDVCRNGTKMTNSPLFDQLFKPFGG